MGKVLIGTCSWTDKSLIEVGTFYPPGVNDAEGRLRYYATQFPIVEVDSTYYALPAEKTAHLWADRTPDGFTFNIKAFSLFTQHPTRLNAFPRDLAKQMPPKPADRPNFYYRDVPGEMRDELWSRFRQALVPLHTSSRLGVVLLQFPRWFNPSRESLEYILEARERLDPYGVAVEFRSASWLDDRHLGQTIGFLRQNALPFVCVDEPQGFRSSVPPMAEATADLALVRFHGRNAETWEKPGLTPSQRFDWYYTPAELTEWEPRIKHLSATASTVHCLMNTNNRDQGPVNGRALASVLREAQLELVIPTA